MSPEEDCLPSELPENSGFQAKLSYQKAKLLTHLVSIIEKYNIVCYTLYMQNCSSSSTFQSKEGSKFLI